MEEKKEEILPKEENKLEDNSNKKKYLIIIIALVILALIGLAIYFIFIKKDGETVANPKENNNVDIIDDNVAKNGELNVYCKTSFDDCWLTTIASEGGKVFYTIETETDNPRVVDENYDIILFDDNGIKVFTEKDKSVKKINLENTYTDYKIVSSDGNLVGVVYQDNNVSGYYDHKTNKTLYTDGKLLNDAYNERFILYLTNNKISIYDKVNSSILKENINLNPDYTDYRAINEVEINDGRSKDKKLIGIFAINESNGNTIYYNLGKNKTMYENSYSYMYLDDNNDYLIGQKELHTGKNYDTIDYVIDPNEEKIIFAPSNTNKHMSIYLKKYNDKYYFIESTDLVEPHYYTKGLIYSNKKELIAEVKYYFDRRDDYIIDEQGYLLIRNDNVINKYNIDGELLDSKTYEKVINITNPGYLVVVNDGKLLIVDNNFQQLAEVIEWNDSYKFDNYPPAYLIEDSMSENPRSNFMAGIYMVLEDGNNYTEYSFNPKDNKITSRKIDSLKDYDLSIYWADLS